MTQLAEKNLVEKGINVLFENLGPEKAIKFFKLIGIQRGDTLKEIEEITEKLSKKEALELVRKARQRA